MLDLKLRDEFLGPQMPGAAISLRTNDEQGAASRSKPVSGQWEKQFMPPIVMTHNKQHVIMGQRKWKVQGGFPHICHGGKSLLEVAAPFIELPEL